MFSGSVSIPSITKSRTEPGRSMSASSGLAARKQTTVLCWGLCTSILGKRLPGIASIRTATRQGFQKGWLTVFPLRASTVF